MPSLTARCLSGTVRTDLTCNIQLEIKTRREGKTPLWNQALPGPEHAPAWVKLVCMLVAGAGSVNQPAAVDLLRLGGLLFSERIMVGKDLSNLPLKLPAI